MNKLDMSGRQNSCLGPVTREFRRSDSW